ncbi:IS5 family transposase [Dankookia rubra]|uniref:IS5 family transposase n=1 Tax=Dankookia rubra TaxID=1442381 RepID=UPI001F4FDCED|nr:IS5 family transposase [Dankookia rubra]
MLEATRSASMMSSAGGGRWRGAGSGRRDLIARPELRAASSLGEIAALLDWAAIDHLVEVSAAPKGEPGWPSLALSRALLLATWHDLSDVRLAKALEARASFRRFCGFAAHEATPERTAFVRFRCELIRRGLDRVLFEAVTRQLEAKGIVVRTGALVDATLIQSASIRHDGDARWAGHRRRKPTHGYKAHIATEEAAGLVRGVEATTANVHDAAELVAVLPDAPGQVYADSAFGGRNAEDVVRARGGNPCAVGTGVWGGPEALARLHAHNAAVRRIRCQIEKVFGTWKRSYGLRRMRWLGLAKAGLQVRLGVIA